MTDQQKRQTQTQEQNLKGKVAIRGGLPLVEQEPETTSWYGMRLGDSTFGIFDTFPDDNGRQTRLAGRVAQELQQRGPDLFSRPPVIERIDVLACKLP
jgi:hypothetical protein